MGCRPSYDEVVRGLRAWVTDHDMHVRAAVELLIGHDVWLHREEFRRTCLERAGEGEWWVDWRAAREAFDAGALRCASSTEVAVLDFAIELGSDRFRFSRMGAASSRLVMDAAARALGGGPVKLRLIGTEPEYAEGLAGSAGRCPEW